MDHRKTEWKEASSWGALSSLTLHNSFEDKVWTPSPDKFVVDKSCARSVMELHEYGLLVFHCTRSQETNKGDKNIQWNPSTFFLVQGQGKESSFRKCLTKNKDLQVRVIGYEKGSVWVIKSEAEFMDFQYEVVQGEGEPWADNFPPSTPISTYSFDSDGYCLRLMQSLYRSNALSGPIHGFFIVAEQDMDLLNVVAQAAAKNLVKEYAVQCSGQDLTVSSTWPRKISRENGLLREASEKAYCSAVHSKATPLEYENENLPIVGSGEVLDSIRCDIKKAYRTNAFLELLKRVDETAKCFQGQLLFDIGVRISATPQRVHHEVAENWLRRARSQNENDPKLLRYLIESVEKRNNFCDAHVYAAQDGVNVSIALHAFQTSEDLRFEAEEHSMEEHAVAAVKNGDYYGDVADRYGITMECNINLLQEIWSEHAAAAQLQQEADNARLKGKV